MCYLYAEAGGLKLFVTLPFDDEEREQVCMWY